MGQLKEKIDIRGKLVKWGGFKLTDKERKELESSEVGFCVSALTDPNVTQEEIRNAEVNSLLGKGLQAFAINYKQTGGGVNQSLADLWDEVDKKSDETSVAARFNNTATKSFVNEAVEVKVNQTEFDDLAAKVDTKADKTDIVDPEWGAITGNLTDQQDLRNALSGKAGIDYVTETVAQKLDVITFEAFKGNTPTIPYVNTELSKKADDADVLSLTSRVDDLSTEVSKKASTSYVDTQVATKASTSYVDTQVATKASTTAVDDLSSRVDDLSTEVSSKVSAGWYDNIEVSSSGWSTTAPYTKNIGVEGIRPTQRLLVDLSTLNVDTASMEAKKEYYACVDQITPGTNTITITCSKEKPAGSFSIKVGVLT